MHNLNSKMSSHTTAEEIFRSFYSSLYITLQGKNYIDLHFLYLNAYNSYQFCKMGEIVQADVDSDQYDG